jgi:hypothetical protein
MTKDDTNISDDNTWQAIQDRRWQAVAKASKEYNDALDAAKIAYKKSVRYAEMAHAKEMEAWRVEKYREEEREKESEKLLQEETGDT